MSYKRFVIVVIAFIGILFASIVFAFNAGREVGMKAANCPATPDISAIVEVDDKTYRLVADQGFYAQSGDTIYYQIGELPEGATSWVFEVRDDNGNTMFMEVEENSMGSFLLPDFVSKSDNPDLSVMLITGRG